MAWACPKCETYFDIVYLNETTTFMKKKKYIGQLISVQFKDRKTPIYGYVVDYNDDWTLMKYNPVDYINSLKLVSTSYKAKKQ